MNSPVEPHAQLVPIELESGLPAWSDSQSGGAYLKSADYWEWLAHQPGRMETLPARGGSAAVLEDADAPARICPESGSLMTRFRVGHGFSFFIDRSPTGGFWLDAGEWTALKERNFHDEIHRVFTDVWQRGVRSDAAHEALEAGFREQLGEEGYARALEFRDWLAGQPNRSRVLAWVSEPLRHGGH
ncbi:hypothetical protein [Luteolibacter sp. LG18]|uniref:hypothetical protein n=1 Tax=Luteolibacter sp. LG18 TaxID=2819286 RepID=UPI002B2B626B|nr:hypothetical protein llg_12090 [Luteolibacter sp. LG18]